MNNSIKGINSKEVTVQLNRAAVQKDILMKNIYKEYEIYFQIVRNSIFASTVKGIYGLYSELSISNNVLNLMELNNLLNKEISLLINKILPLITIEQLKIVEINPPLKQLANVNILKNMEEIKEYQVVDLDHENELISNESFKFNCINNLYRYEYYEFLCDDEPLSVNLDKSGCLNPSSTDVSRNKIEYEKHIVDSSFELIEETNDNKLNDYEKINSQESDFLKSSDNLSFIDIIDQSFNNFLFNLSYKINSELVKINLIKKIISEDNFKYLLNNNYIVKHPHPFVMSYPLDQNKLSFDNNNSSNIYLLNITNVELEYSNLELSICRNNINELKNRLRLLNKKQRYWKDKEITLDNSN